MATNTYKDAVISICTTPQNSDLDKAGFEALTYVQVKKVGNAGDWPADENVLSYNTLDRKVSSKGKGLINAGSPVVECARTYDDPGQIAMRAAGDTALEYAFKLELNDSPNPGTVTNTVIYNRGLVMKTKITGGGGVEDFVVEQYPLELVQEAVIVDPA